MATRSEAPAPWGRRPAGGEQQRGAGRRVLPPPGGTLRSPGQARSRAGAPRPRRSLGAGRILPPLPKQRERSCSERGCWRWEVGPDRHRSAGRAARRPQQPVGRHQGAVSLRCPHPVLVEPSVRRAPASPRARTEGEQRGKPSCSYHWPCSLRKIPEMKTTDARVREEQGCSTARPHVPAGRRGPGKGDPGMRRESPRALLPGSPKKQAEVLRDAPPGHPRSGVRISGSAVPAACTVSPAWVPCRGAGGSGDRTMEEKAGARESGPVA